MRERCEVALGMLAHEKSAEYANIVSQVTTSCIGMTVVHGLALSVYITKLSFSPFS